MLILARVGRLERCCAAGSWLRCSRCATPSKADINQTTADFTGRESDACHELPGNRRTEPKCDLCQDRGPFRLFMSLPNYHPDRTRLCWHMPGVCVSQAQSSRKACQVVASCVAAGTVTARASQARVAKTDMAIREGMLQQRPTRGTTSSASPASSASWRH
ncbi:unnamed protein product [Effrenium voratum]|nr:unnamed protein product [Effrenium voratum]